MKLNDLRDLYYEFDRHIGNIDTVNCAVESLTLKNRLDQLRVILDVESDSISIPKYIRNTFEYAFFTVQDFVGHFIGNPSDIHEIQKVDLEKIDERIVKVIEFINTFEESQSYKIIVDYLSECIEYCKSKNPSKNKLWEIGYMSDAHIKPDEICEILDKVFVGLRDYIYFGNRIITLQTTIDISPLPDVPSSIPCTTTASYEMIYDIFDVFDDPGSWLSMLTEKIHEAQEYNSNFEFLREYGEISEKSSRVNNELY